MTDLPACFEPFHPVLAQWFLQTIGQPTQIQAQAWPKIAAGEHVLATAPTGTGKTLTAFLWAIDRLATGAWPTGQTSVLYISPLRALNNDIQRNLLTPLAQLSSYFLSAGIELPTIRVQTRSGDSSAQERRLLLSKPPEILITTPESLNLLLSSKSGSSILQNIRCVIADEIHAVLESHRGTHLITGIDRLNRLAGEFQRIALSATAKPIEEVARFVGGYIRHNPYAPHEMQPREVAIVSSSAKKTYEVQTCLPLAAIPTAQAEAWQPIIAALRERIAGNQSTLIFVPGRRLAEKLARLLNEGCSETIAFSHHGSLSREIRLEIEQRLKRGELPAIVATNSLELGIDVGAISEVIQILPPATVASAIQRAGRAGHQVGQSSKTTFYGVHELHLLENAVIGGLLLAQDIEATQPLMCPLDLLAQIIISMVAQESRDATDIYHELRTSYPYHQLTREQYDAVVEMLAGRYADCKIRSLRPKISYDRLSGAIQATKGATLELYRSGGSIADRGLFKLRHAQTGAAIGELDEEFVWEAKAGDIFVLGSQSWQIDRITHSDVLALPSKAPGKNAPFWRGEERDRDFHLSQAILDFLKQANEQQPSELAEFIARTYPIDEDAAQELAKFLREQVEQQNCPLVDRHHVILENIAAGPKGAPGRQFALLTMWGGKINRPYAFALRCAHRRSTGRNLEVFASNDAIFIQFGEADESENLLSQVTSGNVRDLIAHELEDSGQFGARFREAAGRSLLLPKRKFNERMPLWMTRLRSQELFEAVRHYGDFPIVVEAWRNCMTQAFDISQLERLLAEIEVGKTIVTTIYRASASSMAKASGWQQVNEYMYRGDEARSSPAGPSLHKQLVDTLLQADQNIPAIDAAICQRFADKVQRKSPGYQPQTAADLVEWCKERLVLPQRDFELFADKLAQEGADDLDLLAAKLVRIDGHCDNVSWQAVVARENLSLVACTLFPDASFSAKELAGNEPICTPSYLLDAEKSARVIASLLGYYGPVCPDTLRSELGLSTTVLAQALPRLRDAGLVEGALIQNDAAQLVCDRRNYERLLLAVREQAHGNIVAQPLTALMAFIASIHNLGQTMTPDDQGLDQLARAIEQLQGIYAGYRLWETEFLPARLKHVQPRDLDSLLAEGVCAWVATPAKTVAFFDPSQLPTLRATQLVAEASSGEVATDNPVIAVFRDPQASYDLMAVSQASGLLPKRASEALREAAFNGLITCSSYQTIRQPGTSALRTTRTRRVSMPAGQWRRLTDSQLAHDDLEKAEQAKARARVVLERHGIVFRELLLREVPGFRWPDIFRSLRLMELSGEILGGYFFEDIVGLQFMSQAAARRFHQRRFAKGVYWLNACDPASLVGVVRAPADVGSVRRVESTHLCYRGSDLIMLSRRYGRELQILLAANDADLAAALAPLHHLLCRAVEPMSSLVIERINGEAARNSEYLPVLTREFDASVGPKEVLLSRKMSG